MKDGVWINYATGHVEPITEHETDLRDRAVADRLSIPKTVFERFKGFKPDRDRVRFLLWVYANLPLMRVRGHGVYTRFEFSSQDETQPYRAIRRFAGQHFGAAMMMSIANFVSGRGATVNIFPHQLDEKVLSKKTNRGVRGMESGVKEKGLKPSSQFANDSSGFRRSGRCVEKRSFD